MVVAFAAAGLFCFGEVVTWSRFWWCEEAKVLVVTVVVWCWKGGDGEAVLVVVTSLVGVAV